MEKEDPATEKTIGIPRRKNENATKKQQAGFREGAEAKYT
jgi:hypothetical protein